MQGDTRILDLIGILILSFLIWLGFNPSNSLIPSGSVAYSAAETGDQHETESIEKGTGDRDDQQLSDVKTHTEPILLPQKRTSLLKQTQLRGYASYQYYCAVCHGKRGGGNGSNAKNLSIPPRKHNNAPYMANLSDGYLSRVIKEGGASQGLSPLMPPWGGAMGGDEEISNLIAFIRILPDSQMMASLEKNQKSAGMGGHGGHGGGGTDDHGSAEADNHDEPDSDNHDASGADGHHADATDNHGAATADDSHTAEIDDHKSDGADDHHAENEADAHKTSTVDDHQEAEVDEHNEATSTDDHQTTDTDNHMAADAEKPHGMEEVDEHKESSTDNHTTTNTDDHGTETGEQHEAGSEDNHTD